MGVVNATSWYPELSPCLEGKKIKFAETDRDRPLLPKLLPHPDDLYLLEFHTDKTDYHDQMEPVLQRLEEELETKVRRINVGRRRDFVQLLEVIGHDEYGGFPFYFNRRTSQAIGGATPYLNLRRLACGSVKWMFQQQPENLFDMDKDFANKREIGAKGMLMDKLNKSSKSKGGKPKSKGKETTETVSYENLTAAERTKARRAARASKAAKKLEMSSRS